MRYKALHNFSIDVSKGFEYDSVTLEKGDTVFITGTSFNRSPKGHRSWFYYIRLDNGFGSMVEYDVFQSCFDRVCLWDLFKQFINIFIGKKANGSTI